MSDNGQNPTPTPEALTAPPPTISGDVEPESNIDSSARRVVGRPFQPGVSGNPGGRAKGNAAAKAHVRDLSIAVADRMWTLANDPKTPVSEARRLLYDLWVFAWGRPESVVRQRIVGPPVAPAGPLVNINMRGPGDMPMSPEQAYAFLVGRPNADPAQIERAHRIIDEAAARPKPLPAPIAEPAIESTADDQDERPSNVVQLGTRIDQEPAV
jgi:hypothetical protein